MRLQVDVAVESGVFLTWTERLGLDIDSERSPNSGGLNAPLCSSTKRSSSRVRLDDVGHVMLIQPADSKLVWFLFPSSLLSTSKCFFRMIVSLNCFKSTSGDGTLLATAYETDAISSPSSMTM